MFRVKCKSFGRGVKRAPFDWAGFSMGFKAKSYMRRGTGMVKMSMGQWCHRWCVDNFKDFKDDKLEAQRAWFAHLETLPEKMISANKKEICTKDKDYIDAGNAREQFEQLEYGHKNIKNPSAGQLSEILQGFGKDHQETNSQNYCRFLGIEDDVMGLVSANPFAAPSLTAEENEEEKLTEIRLQAEHQKKKEATKKSRPEREFDEAGIRTIMDPQVEERAKNCHERAVKVMNECTELVQSIKASVFLKEFASAVKTLEGRMLMLQTNLKEYPQSDDPLEQAKAEWQKFVNANKDEAEPWKDVHTVKSWAETERLLTTYTLTDKDSIKDEKTRLAGIEKTYDGMLNRVREQKNRLASAFKKKTVALTKQVKKEEQEEEQNEKKRKAENAAQAAATRVKPNPTEKKDITFIEIAMASDKVQEIFREASFAASLKKDFVLPPSHLHRGDPEAR